MKIYKVGGSVRDEFLGRKSSDLDYAVECNSYAEMVEYINKYGKIWQERPEYFTVRAKMPDLGNADFVLCRKDGFYSDGRRPDTVTVGTIYDDLARRDFTMNAIAKDMETLEYIDPFGGQRDIEFRLIRCVGNANNRFEDDALRILRAIRFGIVLKFGIEEKTYDAIYSNAHLLRNISIERIMEELNKMFEEDTKRTIEILSLITPVRNAIFSNSLLQLKAKVYG
jgi:tRNA nucleotidyltransferase (CCA-adding enzyme)